MGVTAVRAENLYVHFPFCRRKCAYCALESRAGSTTDERAAYVSSLAARLVREVPTDHRFRTVYFGGGSPALAYLEPLFAALAPHLTDGTEFTVELHPLDVEKGFLGHLRDGGVNRVSMGLQSTDDEVLADMGRGYTFAEAERAFAEIRAVFENAGVDLIVGYPGEETALSPRHARLAKWGLAHCSAYSLILEEKTVLMNRVRAGETLVPDDETTMNRLGLVRDFLEAIGLRRYEISNYARPGFECRHNQAVWRGEDYLGIGRGACGRLGRERTRDLWTDGESVETLSDEEDAKERHLFSLRTREGLDAATRPGWIAPLDRAVERELLTREGTVYRLTRRGAEVCDSILGELV